MLDTFVLYERTRERAEAMVSRVAPRQRALPTPCEEWQAQELIDHLAGHVRYAASVTNGTDGLDRMVPFREGAGEWRLETALAATALELATHTWDLARSIAADETIDPEVLGTLWDRFLADGPGPPRGPGLIGPAVRIPVSDPLQARFLGQMGRDPVAGVPALLGERLIDADSAPSLTIR